ncbi:19071_t:CDS:1, partial [Rhizophagus irregularis]
TTLTHNSNLNNCLIGITEKEDFWNNKIPSKVFIDNSNSDSNLDFNFDYDESIK